MILLRGIGRRLLLVLGGSATVPLVLLSVNVGTASATRALALGDADPFSQCPPVGSDSGCAQLIVAKPNGTTTVDTDSSQGPYDGSDDTLIGVQNDSGRSLSKISLASAGGGDIFGFDGDGICYPSSWPAARTLNTPPGCPSPALGIGFGPTGYEGPGNHFSDISSNLQTGTVTFSPALRFGGSAYFALEEALTAGQLRAAQGGPVPGPFTVSSRTVQLQLTCVGTGRCVGHVRLVVKQQGHRVSDDLLTSKGHVVIIGSATMSISAGSTGNVVLKLSSTGNSLLKRNRSGLKAVLWVVSGGVTFSTGIVKLP